MSQYIVSARKYRPDSFETLVGQDNIARTLKNSIVRGQLAHAYLFCGPRGVGKTTTARIFAKMINCSNPSSDMEPCGCCESCVSFQEGRSYCIHELDAASNNGVDDIKALMDQVQIPPQVGKYSVYIIDEVHMLSQSAFNAFLKTLEEPPSYAIFILATTEKHKILPTILSRCQTYDFNRISISDIVANLRTIAEKEGIDADDESLHIIAQKADGAMRDALTIFDQTVAFCGTTIHYADVIRNLNVLDYEYSFKLVDAFLKKDYASAILIFDEILSKGFNAQYFVSSLSQHIRDLILSCTAGLESLMDMPQTLKQRYKEQGELCSMSFLFDALSVTTQCESGYKSAINQRLHIEFALMKLSFLNGGLGSSQKPAESQGSKPAESPHVKTEAILPPKPESAPAPAPAPDTVTPTTSEQAQSRRRPVHGVSLNSIISQSKDTTEVKVDNPGIAIDAITDEFISRKWKELAATYPSQPRLANAILSSSISVARDGEDVVVTFTVTNESQRKWIEANKLHELEGRLAKLSAYNRISLRVEAAEYVEEKVIYTPEDKAKYLMENVPQVVDIISDLGLDIK